MDWSIRRKPFHSRSVVQRIGNPSFRYGTDYPSVVGWTAPLSQSIQARSASEGITCGRFTRLRFGLVFVLHSAQSGAVQVESSSFQKAACGRTSETLILHQLSPTLLLFQRDSSDQRKRVVTNRAIARIGCGPAVLRHLTPADALPVLRILSVITSQ